MVVDANRQRAKREALAHENRQLKPLVIDQISSRYKIAIENYATDFNTSKGKSKSCKIADTTGIGLINAEAMRSRVKTKKINRPTKNIESN